MKALFASVNSLHFPIMLKKNLFGLLIALLSLSQLSAQDHERLSELYDFPPAQEGDLLCRCISTFLTKANETFYFKVDGTYHEVALSGESISMPFPVRGQSTFTLYSKIINEEGKTVYLPVVEQVLNGSGTNFLIILSRSNDSAIMAGKTYNLNTDNYPANGIYMFNETPLSLGVQVEKVNAVIKPFESYTYDFKDVGRNTYTSAKIAIAYKGKAKIMASKRLRLVPGRRVIMVCFPSQSRAEMGSTPMRVITLQDMPNNRPGGA